MKKRLFIHIGTHKTGSTAIQRSLINHSAQLHKEGIIYVRTLPMCKDLMNIRAVDKELVRRAGHQLNEQIRQYKRQTLASFVVSCEGFSGDPMLGYSNADPIAASLARIFHDFEVTIIVYLRRQDEFIESLYTQKIHEGENYTFDAFLHKLQDSRFNWESLLDNYSKHFGRESIRLHIYDKRLLPNQNTLIRGFGTSIHSEILSRCTNSVIANPGLSRDALEVARLANAYLNHAEQQRLRRILQQSNAKRPFDSYSFFCNRTREAFLSKYATSNANLARKYLNQQLEPLFPQPERLRQNPCQNYQGLNAEGVAIVLARALLITDKDRKLPHALAFVARVEAYLIRKLSLHPRVKKLLISILQRFRLL